MACDGVEELREDGRVEVAGALLEHPQAEVHVAEEPALLGRPERRATAELADAPDVVQERGGRAGGRDGAGDAAARSRGRAS